jgi:hypothetical protein
MYIHVVMLTPTLHGLLLDGRKKDLLDWIGGNIKCFGDNKCIGGNNCIDGREALGRVAYLLCIRYVSN